MENNSITFYVGIDVLVFALNVFRRYFYRILVAVLFMLLWFFLFRFSRLGLSGDRFHFNSNGDGPARYNIIHFKQVQPGKYRWIKVGEYDEGELRLNMDGKHDFKLRLQYCIRNYSLHRGHLLRIRCAITYARVNSKVWWRFVEMKCHRFFSTYIHFARFIFNWITMLSAHCTACFQLWMVSHSNSVVLRFFVFFFFLY